MACERLHLCKYKQYCWYCLWEQILDPSLRTEEKFRLYSEFELVEEEKVVEQKVQSQKNYRDVVKMNENFLSFNGMVLPIKAIREKGRRKKVLTRNGFLFLIQEVDNRLVLIKRTSIPIS